MAYLDSNFGGFLGGYGGGPRPNSRNTLGGAFNTGSPIGMGGGLPPIGGGSVTPIQPTRPTIISTSGIGSGGGTGIKPIDIILNDDIATNDTPVIPAGAYDYGSGKVYTAFTTEDVIEGGTKRVTRGLWSGGSGELTVFHTSSFLSNTQKAYYYEIYNGLPSVSTNEPQFSVAYGHYAGSGSAGTNEDSPSSAIYSQMQQVLLPSNQKFFRWQDRNQDDIYAIAINRARLKDRLDPGNFELHLAKLDGTSIANNINTGSNVHVSASNEVIELIDDSGDTQQAATQIGRVYNLVSGSILNGVYSPKTYYGSVYPEQGVIVLNADTMNSKLNFGTVTGSNINGDNAFKLHTSISGAAVINSNYGFAARNEERVQSTFYFVRAKNCEYNFSNNPSYVTGSNGAFRQTTFANNPKSYITTVGLYNSSQELLAVAKLSQPILKSFSNEVLVKVKLDF